MNSIMTNTILPILGIIIILFCISAFFLPYGDKLKGKSQKIKGFGLDLEISVLTLFFLIGVIMSLACLYPDLCNYERIIEDYKNQLVDSEKKLKEVEIERDLAKEDLVQAKKMEIRIFATLENVDKENMPSLENIQSYYFLYGKNEKIPVDVNPGVSSDQFKIIIKDITPKDHIVRLFVKDISNNRSWFKDSIYPIDQYFNLREE